MKTLSFTVRNGQVPEDVDALLSVANGFDSEPLSRTEFLRSWGDWGVGDPRQRLVAEVEGSIVATSHCRRRSNMTEGLFFVHVYVNRQNWHLGIGTAMTAASEAFAREHGATRIIAFVPESVPEGRAFAERRGYRLTRNLFESILDLDALDSAWAASVLEKATKEGVSFLTLAELGQTDENLRRFFDVQFECDQDEPTSNDVGIMDFEAFERMTLRATWYRPEGAIIAVVDGEWAGVHIIGPADENPHADMSTDFTGVRRPYRGRGVALALKLKGIEYARALGRKRIMTHNDSTNAAMLAVNRKLGFESRPGWLFMTKEFQPKG